MDFEEILFLIEGVLEQLVSCGAWLTHKIIIPRVFSDLLHEVLPLRSVIQLPLLHLLLQQLHKCLSVLSLNSPFLQLLLLELLPFQRFNVLFKFAITYYINGYKGNYVIWSKGSHF